MKILSVNLNTDKGSSESSSHRVNDRSELALDFRMGKPASERARVWSDDGNQKAAELIEVNFELAGATAIEDKLQRGAGNNRQTLPCQHQSLDAN